MNWKRTNSDKPRLRQRQTVGPNRAAAFSYHAKRVEQDFNVGRSQPRQVEGRHRERLVRFWKQRLAVLLSGILIIVCLLNILHLSANPSVVPLTSSSADAFLRPAAIYQQAAAALLKASALDGNKLTVNTDSLKQHMLEQFPELASVSVAIPLISHRPVIYVAPTEPGVVLNTKDGSYILDTNGKALLTADEAADTSRRQLPTLTDQTGLVVEKSHVALPASSVAFLQTVAAQLQAQGQAIQSMVLPAGSADELDVIPAGAGYFIKFNLHDYQHAKEQVGTYLAVRQRLSGQGIQPSKYIDVRLVGRAYYL